MREAVLCIANVGSDPGKVTVVYLKSVNYYYKLWFLIVWKVIRSHEQYYFSTDIQ